jgi:Fe2+ or Zn2+ uptake regulation protein
MGRAQPMHEPMDKHDLRPADGAILDVLKDGRATKGMLVDETGYSRNTVYNRLNVLKAAGHIAVVHEGTRLFELVSDPRCD